MSRNKDLAAALTEKHGLAKTDAEAFVNAMFALINEALASERAVKVKGLGTFKVISVAARKSVDVNTGAPIVIDGRDKISFTPDSSLRDEVNKPFAQFETVVVNDGVDFSEIDRKFEEEETTEDTENAEDKSEVTEDSSEVAEVTEVAEVQSNGREEETTKDTGSTKDTEDTEDIPEVAEDTEVKPEVAEETGSTKNTEDTEDIPEVTEDTGSTQDTEDTKETEETEVKPEVTEETDNTRMVEEVKDEMRAEMKSEHRKMRVLIGACAAFVALCIAGAGYMFTQMQKKDNRISNLEAQVQAFTTLSKQQTAKPQPATTQADTLQGETVATETTAATATTAPATTSAPTTTKPAKTAAAATTTTPSSAQAAKTTAQAGKTAQTAKSAGKNAQTAKSATSDAASANYAKDPRIRTGAYNIVGVDRTVTVKAGQTLSSISHFYLGQGMECYVEAVNGGRTEFKAGEKIKIPKLKHKKMR